MYRLLMVVSLSLYIISVFQPWLIERGTSPLAIHPPFGSVSRFWSFQVVIDLLQGNKLLNSIVLKFQEYWFASPRYVFPSGLFHTWLGVFVFQILGVITGATSIIKEKVKGKPLPLICTITCSTLSLILCYFQLLNQSAPGRGFSSLSINFEIGFSLALISVILWTVPLWIDKLLKRKTMSLILLLIATVIPTVLFMVFLFNIVRFYIKMGSGSLWINWNVPAIGITSRGAGTGIDIRFFVLGLICIPLFFDSIRLLYKEWRDRKKQSTKHEYQAR